jgi:hypothetical protein
LNQIEHTLERRLAFLQSYLLNKIKIVMTKLIAALVMFFTTITLQAQTGKPIQVPMTADRWQFPSKSVEFMQYKGVAAVKILADTAKPLLKDLDFTNGTIEYDVEPVEQGFNGIYFRRQNDEESEYFYLRVARAGLPLALDAAQYAPFVKGVLLWDMLGYDQGPALIKKNEWNHIKLVVSGMQMLVYVNDMKRVALQIPRLEGNTRSGGLALAGKAIFANLVVIPGETSGLSATEGFDPTYHDSRYLREWMVTQPVLLPFGKEVSQPDLPTPTTTWEKLSTERRGLVNLTRLYGNSRERRLVWIKTKINSDKEQIRKLDMGFSDEVWVMLNDRLVYTDKNLYGQPIMKQPDGRCSIENTSFMLPLKSGENELLIGVTNFFYGWGIIARLDRIEGILF